MPKATKDTEKEKLNKKKTSTKKATTATKKKSTTKAKSTTKEIKTTTKKETAKKVDKKASNGKSKTQKTTTSKKKSTTSTTKKSSTARKTYTIKKYVTKKIDKNIVAEYYDLPYRYNETMVKILYQTPTVLFVYWDISDYDRENYIKQYGENFFNNTKPVLKVYNLTKDYNFEVEINDYANSWYINVNDANCEYRVELIRRTIKYEENLNTDYIYISSSNDIEFPNDHILLDELPNKIKFKNVKTNSVSTKDISTLHLIGINKIYNVYDFYKKFYKDEIEENVISDPSSSSWR